MKNKKNKVIWRSGKIAKRLTKATWQLTYNTNLTLTTNLLYNLVIKWVNERWLYTADGLQPLYDLSELLSSTFFYANYYEFSFDKLCLWMP